jgi:hypothetical protein
MQIEMEDESFSLDVSQLDWRKYFFMIYFGPRPKTNAVFAHGSSVRSEVLDRKICELAADILMGEGKADHLVINGLSTAWCNANSVAYSGAETWIEYLDEHGVDADDVIIAPEAKHTAAECNAIIAMAKDRGWESITVLAFPHHVPRVMSQWVECLKRNGSDLKVYARTFDDIDMHMVTSKPLLDGGVVKGVLMDQLALEATNYERYCNPAGKDEKGNFTPNATPEDTIAYMMARDTVVESELVTA